MKITYVLPVYWPAIGGCELHTHELVRRLSERHEINVITQITRQEDKHNGLWFNTIVKPLPKIKEYSDNKARVIPIHLNFLERTFLYPFVRGHRKMVIPSMEAIRYVYQRKIYNLIKDTDIIHCIHNGASFYGYTALKCARKLGIPFVFTPLLQLYQGLAEKLITEGRYDKTHLSYFDKDALELFLLPKGYHDNFWLDICKTADVLIAMTRFEKEFLSTKGIDNAKIYEVGIGPLLAEEYDGSKFRGKYNIGEENLVLFLGRKHENKGFKELLKATSYVWKTHPQTYFCFIGPKEGDADAYFKKYNDKRIIEIDKVTLSEKTNALAACDIFCMPSFFEALGGVFLEAWMFEKPVIAGDTPPVAELLGYGKGGALVDLKPINIAEKIVMLLNDKNLCKNMGEWGKNKVLSYYTWELLANKIENIYQNLIKKG